MHHLFDHELYMKHLPTLRLITLLTLGALCLGCSEPRKNAPQKHGASASEPAPATTSKASPGVSKKFASTRTEHAKQPEVSPEIVATQEKIRNRLIELVKDESTPAEQDAATIQREFPNVTFEKIWYVLDERMVRFRIKGGAEIDVYTFSKPR